MTIYEVDPFWILLKKETGGLPGQERWRRRIRTQWTEELNDDNDRVGVFINNKKLLWMTITGSILEQGNDYAPRMKRFSKMMIDKINNSQLSGERKTIVKMTEHELNKCIDNASQKGRTIRVQMEWDRDNQDRWPDAARWIMQQFEILNAIACSNLE